ncbi:MAG: NAD(P)H-dependent oxidoreductase [Verrucomicrobiota bacterium]
MAEVLLHLIHPMLEKSRVNRVLLERAQGLGDVEVNDLYELYPDHMIDVEREQALMTKHSSIVFQFPFFWYSSPSLLKEWFDLVLQYGWAYGKGANALVGKKGRLAVTTGGSADSYSKEGHNGFTMQEFLCPIFSTLGLCGMEVGDSFFVHGALQMTEDEMKTVAADFEDWLLKE